MVNKNSQYFRLVNEAIKKQLVWFFERSACVLGKTSAVVCKAEWRSWLIVYLQKYSIRLKNKRQRVEHRR